MAIDPVTVTMKLGQVPSKLEGLNLVKVAIQLDYDSLALEA